MKYDDQGKRRHWSWINNTNVKWCSTYQCSNGKTRGIVLPKGLKDKYDQEKVSLVLLLLGHKGVQLLLVSCDPESRRSQSRSMLWKDRSHIVGWLQLSECALRLKQAAPAPSPAWRSSERWRGRTESDDWQSPLSILERPRIERSVVMWVSRGTAAASRWVWMFVF